MKLKCIQNAPLNRIKIIAGTTFTFWAIPLLYQDFEVLQ